MASSRERAGTETSSEARDSPPQQRIIRSKMLVEPLWRNPASHDFKVEPHRAYYSKKQRYLYLCTLSMFTCISISMCVCIYAC